MAGAKCLTESELRSCICPLRKKRSSKNAQQDGKHSESHDDLFHILSSHPLYNTASTALRKETCTSRTLNHLAME